jgi:hypothetical protein
MSLKLLPEGFEPVSSAGFRVAPGRLLHHNYANHYDMWNEDAKVSHIS